MEGNEIAKSATAATTTAKVTDTDARDISGLVFGPAWLRQLSTGGDVTVNNGHNGKNSSNPTSPALTFQPVKHRYSNEDLLNIFKLIEKTLKTIEPPSNLEENFEDLFRKDLQSPVALTPLTLDEQVDLIFRSFIILLIKFLFILLFWIFWCYIFLLINSYEP
jgi:hypothetical protein